MSRWAAVLAGGSGTRFWPLSTAARPKQFLPLSSERPLLVAAVSRLDGLIPPERILVITGRRYAEETGRLLPALPPENVLAEPRAASTGPALAWGTAVAAARDSEASVLSLHADWHIGDDAAFRRTGDIALRVAEEHDVLVTVGVVPTRPDVGYGYVRRGEPLGADAWRVERFVEKPDAEQAARLIAEGALWNSGLFAWRATRFAAETEAGAPEMAPHLGRLADGDVEGFFAAVTPIAVDVSHFERSSRVAVVWGAFPWDDVGTWDALWRVRPKDPQGNVRVGETVVRDGGGNIAWADDGAVVLDGVTDLVVLRANGVTLVTTRDRAQHLKSLLETLPDHLREPTS